jgi:hypothetical protein
MFMCVSEKNEIKKEIKKRERKRKRDVDRAAHSVYLPPLEQTQTHKSLVD